MGLHLQLSQTHVTDRESFYHREINGRNTMSDCLHVSFKVQRVTTERHATAADADHPLHLHGKIPRPRGKTLLPTLHYSILYRRWRVPSSAPADRITTLLTISRQQGGTGY